MSSSAALIVPPSTSATRAGGVAAGIGVQGALRAVDVVGGDEAAVEEGGGGGDGLGDQSAGVAAQVEDDPGVPRGLRDGGPYGVTDALGEGGDLDHGDAAGELADGHGVRGQPRPAQRLAPRACAALQAEGDLRTGGGVVRVPAQYEYDLGYRPAVHLLAVDAAQPVARADPAAAAGELLCTRGHLDPAVTLAPGPQPHARVLTVEGLLELLVLALGSRRRPSGPRCG